MIANVGEDCAGAIQFVRPERVEGVLTGTTADVLWLNESEVAERLRLLAKDHGAWRTERDTGQFSLAGAQPKTALLFQNDRWGVPSGRTPTTHILKPPIAGFHGHAENEHFCLILASKLGMVVPLSKVRRFEEQIAIVVQRYDRISTKEGLRRVHQEDICQSLGLPPSKKYEAEGGAGSRERSQFARTIFYQTTGGCGVFCECPSIQLADLGKRRSREELFCAFICCRRYATRPSV